MVPVSELPLLEPPLLEELETPLLEPEPPLLGELEPEAPPLRAPLDPEVPLLLEAPLDPELPPPLEVEPLGPSVPPSSGSRAVTPPHPPVATLERRRAVKQPTTRAKPVVFIASPPGRAEVSVVMAEKVIHRRASRGSLSPVNEGRSGHPSAVERRVMTP